MSMLVWIKSLARLYRTDVAAHTVSTMYSHASWFVHSCTLTTTRTLGKAAHAQQPYSHAAIQYCMRSLQHSRVYLTKSHSSASAVLSCLEKRRRKLQSATQQDVRQHQAVLLCVSHL
jgi:hypothetical protein